jgi:hypothetical protein
LIQIEIALFSPFFHPAVRANPHFSQPFTCFFRENPIYFQLHTQGKVLLQNKFATFRNAESHSF